MAANDSAFAVVELEDSNNVLAPVPAAAAPPVVLDRDPLINGHFIALVNLAATQPRGYWAHRQRREQVLTICFGLLQTMLAISAIYDVEEFSRVFVFLFTRNNLFPHLFPRLDRMLGKDRSNTQQCVLKDARNKACERLEQQMEAMAELPNSNPPRSKRIRLAKELPVFTVHRSNVNVHIWEPDTYYRVARLDPAE